MPAPRDWLQADWWAPAGCSYLLLPTGGIAHPGPAGHPGTGHQCSSLRFSTLTTFLCLLQTLMVAGLGRQDMVSARLG